MDKQIVAYLYSGILLRYKKEKKPTDTHNTVNLKKIMLSERSQTQKRIYSMIPLT